MEKIRNPILIKICFRYSIFYFNFKFPFNNSLHTYSAGHPIECAQNRVLGLGFAAQGLGFRVCCLGFSVQGLQLRVLGLGFADQGLGFSVCCLGFRVQCLQLRVLGLGFAAQGLGLRVCSLGFRAQGLQLRVQGLGLRVCSLGLVVLIFVGLLKLNMQGGMRVLKETPTRTSQGVFATSQGA